MNLPDFTSDPNLIALKLKMGLDADAVGSFSPQYRPGALTLEELKQLESEGIDVPIEEIIPLEDGTLGYKDRRVIVYKAYPSASGEAIGGGGTRAVGIEQTTNLCRSRGRYDPCSGLPDRLPAAFSG